MRNKLMCGERSSVFLSHFFCFLSPPISLFLSPIPISFPTILPAFSKELLLVTDRQTDRRTHTGPQLMPCWNSVARVDRNYTVTVFCCIERATLTWVLLYRQCGTWLAILYKGCSPKKEVGDAVPPRPRRTTPLYYTRLLSASRRE